MLYSKTYFSGPLLDRDLVFPRNLRKTLRYICAEKFLVKGLGKTFLQVNDFFCNFRGILVNLRDIFQKVFQRAFSARLPATF